MTLVLYFGLDRWRAAKSLYEAVCVDDKLKRFIPDMPINLVEIAWLENDVIDKFKSDFKIVARFFQQLRIHGRASMEMQDPVLLTRIEHVLELMRMFSAYTGDPLYENYGISHLNNKEVTMLAVLKEYEEEKIREGRKEGRKEGRTVLNSIYASLLSDGRTDDMMRAIRDPEYLKKILAEFGINDDEDAKQV